MNLKDFKRTMRKGDKELAYECLGKAYLYDYRLGFNAYSFTRQGGVLDIQKCIGNQVIGILYELSEEAMKQVDIREGSKYMRITVDVIIDNKRFSAYTYVIRNKINTKANINYSGIVYRAMLEHGFPTSYVEDFVKLVRISAYGSEKNYFIYKENKNKEIK